MIRKVIIKIIIRIIIRIITIIIMITILTDSSTSSRVFVSFPTFRLSSWSLLQGLKTAGF